MFSPSVIEHIKATVCGVGASRIDLEAGRSLYEAGKLSKMPPPLIGGTAFFVGERVLMTNRHVLDGLNDEQFNNRRLLAFHQISLDGETAGIAYVAKFAQVLLSNGPRLKRIYDIREDLALVLLREHLVGHPWVTTLAADARVHVGEPIAVCGYPWGNDLLDAFADPTMQRMGPIVTFGHIAAIAPFDGLAQGAR